jgi:hypothetical protein
MFDKELHMTMRSSVAWTCLAFALMTIAPAAAQAPADQHAMHQLHGDPAAYIAALEDPGRDAYQKPHEVMQALDVKEGLATEQTFLPYQYFLVFTAAD